MSDKPDTNNKPELLDSIIGLIDQSRHFVAKTVNQELTLLYWKIGKTINKEILKNDRADYGKKIIQGLSLELSKRYGTGFSKRNIHSFIKLNSVFQDYTIVQTVSAQLSWSHLYSILSTESDLKREFYIQMSIHERWSVRTLQERIDSMLFERTAISKKPEETIVNDLASLKNEKQISPDLTFRDPYFLDFLGLHDTYSEKDLESSILAQLQKFITEMGSEFAFLARQKRITIDDEDFYIDLLFYHRGLRRLVAIDLKPGKFKAGYKGQIELYLRWLEKNEQKEGKNKPIGLILCSEKSPEQINYLMLDNDQKIKVSAYFNPITRKKIIARKTRKSHCYSRK
ncbi:PDDEXK nuclease domain-containing protein [Flavobacterium collinsii]|uniref:Nuclease YhcG n=1 Tax=Flavobacterium collinsii TaxID=1114861 RepID=A0ABN7EI56_9FLAO|nr:PDDEXK nuclease domain-containing protein [Flavobacterium collinsii]CAA9196761.1 Putative nuclease YhcG [Flavobacterium collinsii]